jgi:hypothetical protein
MNFKTLPICIEVLNNESHEKDQRSMRWFDKPKSWFAVCFFVVVFIRRQLTSANNWLQPQLNLQWYNG